MKLVVDEEKLYVLLKDFHQLTGLKVSFSKDYDTPILGVPHNICALCRYKQNDREFYLRCKASDKKAYDIASRSDEAYIYECHYHLTEALQPVVVYGKHVGYFQIGQMLTDRDKFIRLNRPTDYELSLLDDLASPSLETLRSAAAILSSLAKYTVIDRYIGLSAQQNLDAVLEYIEEHYREHITVADLCRIFHYSRPSLFMHFKNELNQGITSYINDLRLEKSKALLEEHSVKEVASLVGFEDANYFSRIFKKKYGVSPSAFSKKSPPPGNKGANGAIVKSLPPSFCLSSDLIFMFSSKKTGTRRATRSDGPRSFLCTFSENFSRVSPARRRPETAPQFCRDPPAGGGDSPFSRRRT